MWKPTAQENLWFHGGNLTQSRHYSRFLALQLKARLEGLPTPVYGQGAGAPHGVRILETTAVVAATGFVAPSAATLLTAGLLVLHGRADPAEDRLQGDAERRQRSAADDQPSGSGTFDGGLPALDQGAGVSPESVGGLSGPVTMAYLHGPAAPGENAEQVVPIDIPF